MKRNIQTALNEEERKILKPIISDPEDEYLIFECPHCELFIQVLKTETRCCVFRHGAYKSDVNEQVPPHTAKNICEQLLKDDKVYGCCCPFYFCKDNDNINNSVVIMCDYI
jgi:hypothetical protein|tara:strand:- start:1820 stop:2152 length:333 start_codon:yes stop_codon:yes gene_type:complete